MQVRNSASWSRASQPRGHSSFCLDTEVAEGSRVRNGTRPGSRYWPRQSLCSVRMLFFPIRREIPVRLPRFSPGQNHAFRPCRPRHSFCETLRSLSQSGADHAVPGHQLSKLLFAPSIGSFWTAGNNQVTKLSGGVPNADLGVAREFNTKFSQHGAGLGDRARTIWRRLVPKRRQTEYRPRVAGAECANDDVVNRWRIFECDQMIARPAPVT